ncbi:hypothetical protein ACEPAI_7941 [Sanghuangporus weigelae]
MARNYSHFQLHRTTNYSISGKLILVIGATGAQGIAVIDTLLSPGSPSLQKERNLPKVLLRISRQFTIP